MIWKPQFYGGAARPVWRGYMLAVLFSSAALVIRMALGPIVGDIQPFAFFYLSVALTAWFGGLRPALVAFVLGLLAGWGLFVEPAFSFGMATMVRLLTYTAVSACFGALLYFARQSERLAVKNASRLQAARDQVQHHTAVFEGLAESVIDAILIVSPQGKILFTNEQFRRMWKFPPEVLALGSDEAALKWAETQVPDPVAFREGVVRAYSQWDKPIRGEMQLKDGRIFDRYGAPVVHKGVQHAWVWTFRDITAQKQAEEQLRRNQESFYQNFTERMRVHEALRESEERFRAVADNIPQLAWMTDPAGEVIWCNRRWSEFTGLTLEQMRLAGWKAVHHPEYGGRVLAGWARAMESGEPWEDTFPLRGRSGSYSWFLSRAMPIRDEQGKVVRWFGTNTDITELREAQEQAERSRAEQQAILQREADIRQTLELALRAGRIGTYEWDVVNDRHVWSEQTEEFFGYRPGEFPGNWEGLSNRIHPDDREWLGKAVKRSFERQERDHSFYYRSLRPDGSIACLIVRGRVEFSSERKPLRVVGVVVDVTAMKKSEEALAAARQQLAQHAANLEKAVAERTAELTETVQELEAFSYSLSHDMRAPLRAMKGFSEILEAEFGAALGEEGRNYLRRISAAAGRLDQLIRDVLTYSRIVREKIELQPIDLDRLARQLVDENPALQPPKAEIQIDSPLQPVLGHEAYLMQVISNLVYNAVKFVAPGRQPNVRIWTEPSDSLVRLCVQDNGIGIPDSARQRVFGMFQRLHTENVYEGTGIGLTIVRKAVERMGGEVGIESAPGDGSTFWVQLRRP